MSATLVDEFVRAGLTDAVICPGSRSTPLTLAFAARHEVTVHVRLDERGAAFFALGRARATGRPVAVVVTSGTAAAELHAAVAEADLAGVPLLVLTADRPPELHGVGAAQTIEQRHLYGPMVRLFEDVGVARVEGAEAWRPLAARLYAAASGPRPGPVHLNAPFVEPLIAPPGEIPTARDQGPWVVADSEASARAAGAVAGARVMCVTGTGASSADVAAALRLGWAVVGDATARGTLPYVDALLRDDELAARLRPEVVVRLGGLVASRTVAARLLEWGVPVVAVEGALAVADPDGVVTRRVAGALDAEDGRARGDAAYARQWREVCDRVDAWIVDALGEELTEVAVARDVVEAANESGVALVIGSSMPVRDVEWWAPPRTGAVYANRGANGIDGVVSTALGVASGTRALALVGDLTLLHDLSALVDGVGEVGGTLVVVVVDNAGGGIFSFLAPARELEAPDFERLFATPRPVDLVGLAEALGHRGERVTSREGLRLAVTQALAREGVSLVVADVPSRARNVAHHEAMLAGAQSAGRAG
jgi:2-succinyl-5-enolpyruvyl-6-hydroxy-3-cyclohexene-1-carboxylate synthase